MLATPGRIDEVIQAVEQRQPVDWQQLDRLLELDILKLGEDAVAQSLARQEQADELLAGKTSRSQSVAGG